MIGLNKCRSVWKYSPRPGWMTPRVTGSGFRSWFDTGSGRRWWITGDWRVLIEITGQTKAAGMCTPSADGFFVGQRPAWLETFAIKTGNGISWRWAWNITYWLGFLNANGQFQGTFINKLPAINQKLLKSPNARQFYFEFKITKWGQNFVNEMSFCL